MTLYTTTQFAQAFADMLEAQGVPLDDEPGFVAEYAEALEGWLGGGEAIPAELAYKLKQTLGYWNGFSSGMVDFLTIPADGGPNGDGMVTIVDGLGVAHTIDSLAKLTVEMAGIIIKGTVASVGELPSAGQQVGDLWLVVGDGYVWDGSTWKNIGPIRGPEGQAATIQIGTVSTVAPGDPAAVINSGSENAAVLDFDIPRGETGAGATIAIGEVVTGEAGSAASVENVGTPTAAVLDFTIPQGDKGDQGAAATIAVGDVTTVAPGQPAAVNNSGTSGAAVLDFDIPQGVPGEAATIAIGEVVTVAPGEPAAVSNSGTPVAAVLDFEIPKGAKGDRGDAFVVDAVGPIADRGLYDAEPPGFSFLATDESLIYFRIDPVGWSAGAPFGKGEDGASAYQIAVDNGFVGTEAEWLASLKGTDGSDANVTRPNIEAALGGPVVLTVNGQGPDLVGNVEVDAAGALKSDLIRVFLALAELRGNQFGTPNGVADDFSDQDGVDSAASTGETYDAAGRLYRGGGGASYEDTSSLPVMTSNTAPAPHEAAASTENATNQAAWMAFDGSMATSFWSTSTSPTFPHWLRRRTAEPLVVGAYRLSATSSGYAPRNFTFEGANSATGPWTVLDTQVNQAFTSGVAKTFALPANTAAFLYHRINVTATSIGTNVTVAELEILARTFLLGTIDLRSISYAAASAPSKASFLAMARAGVAIVPGTNFHAYVSRDDGATWAEATLTARETVSGFTVLDAYDLDLSAQPVGMSMKWRVSATDYALFEIGAAALMWN